MLPNVYVYILAESPFCSSERNNWYKQEESNDSKAILKCLEQNIPPGARISPHRFLTSHKGKAYLYKVRSHGHPATTWSAWASLRETWANITVLQVVVWPEHHLENILSKMFNLNITRPLNELPVGNKFREHIKWCHRREVCLGDEPNTVEFSRFSSLSGEENFPGGSVVRIRLQCRRL